MVEAIMVLVMGMLIAGVLAACGRGVRIPGPSWFEIPHDTNRAARRARR